MTITRHQRYQPANEIISRHYDELDPFYREVWGEHVHHGLWQTGSETSDEAVRALVDLAAQAGQITPGTTVVDVGSGYGATARQLAAGYGATVTSLTISQQQWQYANTRHPGNSQITYLLRDWLDNGLPEGSADVVIAIESVAHMDSARAFAECFRVLRPGGRVVVCDWLLGESLGGWRRRWLIEPIERAAHVNKLEPMSGYRDLLIAAGFTVERTEDLSSRVRRTWAISNRRFALRVLRERRYRRFVFSREYDNRPFALAMLRMPIAYRTSAMHYGLLVARKPALATGPAQNLPG